jgi:protein-S-isoprenylcysteine O-methyltransferase Ste14
VHGHRGEAGDNVPVRDLGVAVSIIGFAIALAGIASLLFLRELFANRPLLATIQALALLLMIWARVTFGRRSFHAAANPTPGGIVTAGPYRFWRHPIYAAIIFFVWAGVAAHFRPSTALLALAVTSGLFVRMIAEERLLRRQYPAYVEYAARTSRLIPWVL